MQRQTRSRQTTDHFGPGHASISRRTDFGAPTIAAAYPRLLFGLLEGHDLDGRALLREAGLSTLRLEESEVRVTSQQYQAIAAAAFALSGGPGLGT